MKQKKLRRSIVLLMAVTALAAAPNSWAWGREGHRLTAEVAERYLTPETAAAVQELLGSETMEGVSSWADDYRHDHPETGPWHYLDTPKKDATYKRDRDCPVSKAVPPVPFRECVVESINFFEKELGDRSLPHEERYRALKFLIHFIGDIHQPFHAIGDARGGNDVVVTFLGSSQCGSYKCELHGVWDSSLITNQKMDEERFANYLQAEIVEHDWQRLAGGTPEQWATASHRLAVKAWLPNGADVEDDYIARETPVVDQQLALGGLRLAHVLNTILGGQSVPPMVKTHGPVPMVKQ